MRHDAITQISQTLQPLIKDEQIQLRARLDAARQELRHQQLLSSREYSFCLFSSQTLPTLLLELSVMEP